MKHLILALTISMITTIAHAQRHEKEFTLILSDSLLLSTPAKPKIRESQMAGIRLRLKNLYVLDGLLWFVIDITNTSVFDWRANPMRFSIRDKKTWRRRARQEIPLPIIARRETLLVRSDSSAIECYALIPRLPTKGQNLFLEYSNRTGDQTLTLHLTSKQLLKAKKISENANPLLPKTPQQAPPPPPIR